MAEGPSYESHIGLTDQWLPIIFKPYTVAVGSDRDIVHWHEGIEIFFITGGRGYVLCDSLRIPAGKGNIIVINSNQIHRAMAGSEDLKYEYLIIEPALFEMLGLVPEQLRFQSGIDNDDVLWACLRQLVDCRVRNTSYSWIVREGLIIQLIGRLMECFYGRRRRRISRSRTE